MKNFNDTIGNRTRDLPICSSVPQPTVPPRTPFHLTVVNHSWFQTFAVFWIYYVFFWVVPRRLNYICRGFGTLYLFHLHRHLPTKMEQIECSEKSAYIIQTPGNHPKENIIQSGPKKCIHSLLINIFGINLNEISISGWECNTMFSQQMAQALL